jgi:DNA-binding NarL/FixJ family response regulator
MGDVAVQTNVASGAEGAAESGGRVLRVAMVWGVRFARESLVEILERDPLLRVIGQYSDLSEAAALGSAERADVVLLDGRIAGIGAEVRRFLEIEPGMRVIVAAVREAEEEIVAWAEAGVIGYIPRTTALADFARRIIDIESGEQICSGKVATGLLRRIATAAKHGAAREAGVPTAVLTKREQQTAALITSGLSDKEIARQLNISLATTKAHVHNLLGKLNVQRRSQVAGCLREADQLRT